MNGVLAIVAAVVIGTWNGKWFPSGRAEHRADPEVEDATIGASAKMLAAGLRQFDPFATNDVILCLNEIRGPAVASNLVERIGRKGLRVASVSGYRRRDRFDQQQDVIATTLPVVEASWSRWRNAGRFTPPRGYAFAAVLLDPATTARVYAVHLKSNYGATTPAIADANRQKRTNAISQIVNQEKIPKRRRRASPPVVIVGDMNADKWRAEFASEQIFNIISFAGFTDLLELLPPDRRGTHPSARYGDSALDYIFVRGLRTVGLPCIVPNEALSDHYAVWAVVEK